MFGAAMGTDVTQSTLWFRALWGSWSGFQLGPVGNKISILGCDWPQIHYLWLLTWLGSLNSSLNSINRSPNSWVLDKEAITFSSSSAAACRPTIIPATWWLELSCHFWKRPVYAYVTSCVCGVEFVIRSRPLQYKSETYCFISMVGPTTTTSAAVLR